MAGGVFKTTVTDTLAVRMISSRCVEDVELRDVITQIADDLLTGPQSGREWWERYPGH